jgi:hypothetical protein
MQTTKPKTILEFHRWRKLALTKGTSAKPVVDAERSDRDGLQGEFRSQSRSYWQGTQRGRPPESERFGAATGFAEVPKHSGNKTCLDKTNPKPITPCPPTSSPHSPSS